MHISDRTKHLKNILAETKIPPPKDFDISILNSNAQNRFGMQYPIIKTFFNQLSNALHFASLGKEDMMSFKSTGVANYPTSGKSKLCIDIINLIKKCYALLLSDTKTLDPSNIEQMSLQIKQSVSELQDGLMTGPLQGLKTNLMKTLEQL